MSKTRRRTVFFDLDGTLHRQDMFGCFIRYLLCHQPLNLLLVVPLLPVIISGLLIFGRATRWPMSLLLWASTFGHSEPALRARQARFCGWFNQRVTAFDSVQRQLNTYLASGNADVWLITGSPRLLVENVYGETAWLGQVQLIASEIERRLGGWTLSLRCLGYEKVVQLERRIGSPLELYSGYSDSSQDNPLLGFCRHRWRVTPRGELQQLE